MFCVSYVLKDRLDVIYFGIIELETRGLVLQGSINSREYKMIYLLIQNKFVLDTLQGVECEGDSLLLILKFNDTNVLSQSKPYVT